MKTITTGTLIAATALLGLTNASKARAADEMTTRTGEVVDLVCYIDHGASGEGHAKCANKCIKSGLPVGLKTHDGTYLLVGEHKPLNAKLARLAAKTITVQGKLVEKDGMKMIENAEIVEK